MNKKERFEQFLKKMEDCNGCFMRGYGEPVFSGYYKQEIMIIGYEPESHNIEISSNIVSKAAKLLSLYENKVKYGAYITYLYRCSLHVHGELNDEARHNCKELLKEEFQIVLPEYVLIYDERVINEICDNPDKVKHAKKYPVNAKIFDIKTKIYYI